MNVDRAANKFAKSFAAELAAVRFAREKREKTEVGAETLHVSSAGAALSELYETLRNASENAEENLLLIHAISRYFRRTFLLTGDATPENPAENLLTELTLAGYLKNDSVSLARVAEIDDLIREFSALRRRLLVKFSREIVERWANEPLAAAIENALRDHGDSVAFSDLGYDYFLEAIDFRKVFGKKPANYEATLFVAVSRVLLRQDDASIRLNLLNRYRISRGRAVDFAKFSVQLDRIFASPELDKLAHLVSRNGASFRILLATMNSDAKLSDHLTEEKSFLGPFDAAISASYAAVARAVNRGIVRSVIFLVITKFIIGVAAEVPFDFWAHGRVMWLPLTVNLLLPPLYMIALRLTLRMPGPRNRRALTADISRILFEPPATKPTISATSSRKFGAAYNFIYLLTVILVFGGVSWLLVNLAKFEWIHLLIFFIFISTASFLGFRLSRMIRDLEVGDEAQTSLSLARDFIYMPFVAVGSRVSAAYARVNIVSRFLDMFVELPLKTLLGFFRQWGKFLSSKKDDL